jgi:hypothetical protein
MDINIVFSGGVQNTTQIDSLGGFPSPVSPTDNKNNLFNNISPRQTTQGWTDYRCLYVFNDNNDLRYETKVFIEYLSEIGATIYLGLLLQNDVQKLDFTANVPTGGTFTISIHGMKSDTITWDSSTTTLATRIQEAISAVVECTVAVPTPGTHIYTITFQGILGNKALTSMSVTDNALTPSVSPSITKVTTGSPINTIAPDIGDEKTVPTGIPFITTLTPGTLIGTLFPSEGFPVWIKRVVAPGFEAVEEDGFKLHINATGILL